MPRCPHTLPSDFSRDFMLLIRTPIAFFYRECILQRRSRSRDERLLIWVSSFTCRRSRFSQSSTVFSNSPQIYFD